MNERHNLSKAMKMVEILIAEDMKYIFDEDNKLYYLISNKVINHPVAVDTEEFKEFCLFNFYKKYDDTITDSAFKQSLSILKGSKKDEITERVKLNNRVAFVDGAISHQLSQENIVRVSKNGVTIENESPELFKIFGHQESIPKPVFNNGKSPVENLALIFDYANITDENQRILFQVSLIYGLIPDVPHPIDLFAGGPGSAKTTTSQIKKSLIDPVSRLKGFSLPRNEGDFLLMASQHYVLTIDNMPFIKNWQSDMFCKAVTGDATSRRRLYTDNEQILYRVRCCLVLNGLHVPTIKSDFLDRCILFNLNRVADKKRKEESVLNSQFVSNKPLILGAMYTILSEAMKIYENIEIENLYRMADFTKWGCAIAKAMGYSEKDFIRAYTENSKIIREELGSTNSLIDVLISYVNSREERVISETPTELLTLLYAHARKKLLNLSGLPTNAVHLTRKLKELAHIFEEEGISIETRKSGNRKIIIEKIPSYCPEYDKNAKNELKETVSSHNISDTDRREIYMKILEKNNITNPINH